MSNRKLGAVKHD